MCDFFFLPVLWCSHSARQVDTNIGSGPRTLVNSAVRCNSINLEFDSIGLSPPNRTQLQDKQQHRINISNTHALAPSIANKLVIQFKFSSLWSYFAVRRFFFFLVCSVHVVGLRPNVCRGRSWELPGTWIRLVRSDCVAVPTIANVVGVCECECFRSDSVYIN